MSIRIELPSRRQSVTQKVKIAGCTLFITVGFYDEDKTLPGEIFLILDDAGEKERILVDCLARMTSVAIQYGAPIHDLMERQWLGLKGKVCGPVQGDDRIKNCTSALDYCARYLLVHYCHRDDLAHVKEA